MFDNETPKHLRGAQSFAFFSDLFARAQAAGRKAGETAVPVPMIVGTAKGLSDEIDETKPVYNVPDGACGFAWVNVRPGTSRFAKWLKNEGHARSDSYQGGVTIWIGEHGQSVARKEAHAGAMADVLREGGFKAYAYSRLD